MGKAEDGVHRSGYKSGQCSARYGYTVMIVFLKGEWYR